MTIYNNLYYEQANNAPSFTEEFNVRSLIEHRNLTEIFEERKELFQQKLEVRPAVGEEYKIPLVLNYVWGTKSREIGQSDLDNIIHNQKLFLASNPNWKFVVHMNNKALNPISTKFLEDHNVIVKNLNETIADENELTILDRHIERGEWGIYSDYARLLILRGDGIEGSVNQGGGVYADLNFRFVRTIDTELKTYDFLAQDCVNYFFAARAGHPIIEGAIDIIVDNLENTPAYIQGLSDVFSKTIVSTMIPLCISYLKFAHIDENQDLVQTSSNGYFLIEEGKSFPEEDSYWAIPRLNNAFGHLNEYEIIGIDGFNGEHLTWI